MTCAVINEQFGALFNGNGLVLSEFEGQSLPYVHARVCIEVAIIVHIGKSDDFGRAPNGNGIGATNCIPSRTLGDIFKRTPSIQHEPMESASCVLSLSELVKMSARSACCEIR